jgi:hypothetical protein
MYRVAIFMKATNVSIHAEVSHITGHQRLWTWSTRVVDLVTSDMIESLLCGCSIFAASPSLLTGPEKMVALGGSWSPWNLCCVCIDWFAIPLEFSPKFEICHASAAHKNSPLAKRLKNWNISLCLYESLQKTCGQWRCQLLTLYSSQAHISTEWGGTKM